jgi:hypothetical protein
VFGAALSAAWSDVLRHYGHVFVERIAQWAKRRIGRRNAAGDPCLRGISGWPLPDELRGLLAETVGTCGLGASMQTAS